MGRIFLCMLVHVALLILLSCESDSVPHVCRLTSLRVLDDSTVFEYNTANKVKRIVHHILGADHTWEDVLEYDDNGRLIHVSFFGSDPTWLFKIMNSSMTATAILKNFICGGLIRQRLHSLLLFFMTAKAV